MGEVFLKLENIKKSFGGVQALKGVDLEIMLEAAEVHIGGTDAGQFVVCHHQFRM